MISGPNKGPDEEGIFTKTSVFCSYFPVSFLFFVQETVEKNESFKIQKTEQFSKFKIVRLTNCVLCNQFKKGSSLDGGCGLSLTSDRLQPIVALFTSLIRNSGYRIISGYVGV